jgi:hypothetical protein
MKYQIFCEGTLEQHSAFLRGIEALSISDSKLWFEDIFPDGRREASHDMTTLTQFIEEMPEKNQIFLQFGPRERIEKIVIGADYLLQEKEKTKERILFYTCQYTKDNHDALKKLFRESYGHTRKWRESIPTFSLNY